MSCFALSSNSKNYLHTAFIQPYKVGAYHLKQSLRTPLFPKSESPHTAPQLSFKKRIQHFVVGMIMITPILNTIIYLAVQRFKHNSSSLKPVHPIQAQKSALRGPGNTQAEAKSVRFTAEVRGREFVSTQAPKMVNKVHSYTQEMKGKVVSSFNSLLETLHVKKRVNFTAEVRGREFDREQAPTEVSEISSFTQEMKA